MMVRIYAYNTSVPDGGTSCRNCGEWMDAGDDCIVLLAVEELDDQGLHLGLTDALFVHDDESCFDPTAFDGDESIAVVTISSLRDLPSKVVEAEARDVLKED